VHGLQHWVEFYTDYGVALQKRFFGHFLKGEDTGWDSQPPHSLALPLEHLGQQVLRHRPFGAGELGREPLRVRVGGGRKRSQPQPCRPALGPLVQHRHRRPGQFRPRRREQLPRLRQAEPQVARADLGKLPVQPAGSTAIIIPSPQATTPTRVPGARDCRTAVVGWLRRPGDFASPWPTAGEPWRPGRV
jgi:hypothetical protein